MSDDNDWIEAMRLNGHMPIMRDEDEGGGLDIWVMDQGYHNGPGCSSCGMSWCHHCDSPSVVGPCHNPVLDLKANKPRKALPNA